MAHSLGHVRQQSQTAIQHFLCELCEDFPVQRTYVISVLVFFFGCLTRRLNNNQESFSHHVC